MNKIKLNSNNIPNLKIGDTIFKYNNLLQFEEYKFIITNIDNNTIFFLNMNKNIRSITFEMLEDFIESYQQASFYVIKNSFSNEQHFNDNLFQM